MLLLLLRSFKQKVDPFQFGCDSKGMKPCQTPSIKQSTRQRKAINAKPQGEEKRTKREDPSRSQKRRRLTFKRRFTCPENLPIESTNVVEICTFGIKRRLKLAWRIYPSSTKVEICSVCALFICSLSHSHHRHYACTLPLSK